MIVTGITSSAPATHHADGQRLLLNMLSRFRPDAFGDIPAQRHEDILREITADRNGKPRLGSVPFSVSHSAGLVMCSVFCPQGLPALPCPEPDAIITLSGEGYFKLPAKECAEIGADIEHISEARDADRLLALSRRYFSPAEREYVLSGENTAERFFRIWTRKESCIKMTGEGLPALSRTDTFNIPPDTLIHSVTLLCGGGKYSVSVCFGARR